MTVNIDLAQRLGGKWMFLQRIKKKKPHENAILIKRHSIAGFVSRRGYSLGMLMGEEIPIEARISAVADVFDALTSRRSYKAPWSNEEAFAVLRQMSNSKLDWDCVEALLNNADKVLEIQHRFRDNNLI